MKDSNEEWIFILKMKDFAIYKNKNNSFLFINAVSPENTRGFDT